MCATVRLASYQSCVASCPKGPYDYTIALARDDIDRDFTHPDRRKLQPNTRRKVEPRRDSNPRPAA